VGADDIMVPPRSGRELRPLTVRGGCRTQLDRLCRVSRRRGRRYRYSRYQATVSFITSLKAGSAYTS
jgi:hypothetical protein